MTQALDMLRWPESLDPTVVAVGLLGAVGVVLVFLGARTVRGLFIVGLALAGAAGGGTMGAGFSSGWLGPIGAPLVGALVGAVVGAMIGRALVRPAIGVMVAACGAAAAFAGVAWSDGLLDRARAEEPAMRAGAGETESPSGSGTARAELATQVRASWSALVSSPEQAEPAAALRSIAASRWSEAEAWARGAWAGVPEPARRRLLGACAAGAAAGLLLGLVAPRRTLAVGTAAVGAACVVGAIALASGLGGGTAPIGVERAAAVWAVVASVGVACQWRGVGGAWRGPARPASAG